MNILYGGQNSMIEMQLALNSDPGSVRPSYLSLGHQRETKCYVRCSVFLGSWWPLAVIGGRDSLFHEITYPACCRWFSECYVVFLRGFRFKSLTLCKHH